MIKRCPKCGTSEHVTKETRYSQKGATVILRCSKCKWKDVSKHPEDLSEDYKEVGGGRLL